MTSSSRHVVIVCEDAGPAAALVHLARRLGSRATVIATGQASDLFAAAGIATRPLAELSLADATALVTGTTAWGERIEAQAVVAARAHHVPSIGFVDFWSNYAERFRLGAGQELDAVPDRVAVVDLPMRDGVIGAGVEATRVVVTGSPAFDAAAASAAAGGAVGEHVLFLSQPFAALYGRASPLGYDERDVLAMLADAAAQTRASLQVRPHPREDAAALAAFLTTLPGRVAVAPDEPLAAAIASARATIGMCTAALVEAALLGGPTLSIQPTETPTLLPSIQSGATPLVRTVDEVASWLAALGARPPRAALRRVAETGAVERLVALLDATP